MFVFYVWVRWFQRPVISVFTVPRDFQGDVSLYSRTMDNEELVTKFEIANSVWTTKKELGANESPLRHLKTLHFSTNRLTVYRSEISLVKPHFVLKLYHKSSASFIKPFHTKHTHFCSTRHFSCDCLWNESQVGSTVQYKNS